MENIRVVQYIRPQDNSVIYRLITDEVLGIVAKDYGEGPYVDIFLEDAPGCTPIEGVDMAIDTVNVWRYGEKKREDDDRVLDLVLDWFRTNREEDEEE